MCFWQTKPNTAPTPPRPTPQSPVVLQHPGGQGPLYNPQPYLSSYISQIHSVPVRKPKINKHGHLRRLSLNVVLNTFYKYFAGIWNMPIKSQIFTWNWSSCAHLFIFLSFSPHKCISTPCLQWARENTPEQKVTAACAFYIVSHIFKMNFLSALVRGLTFGSRESADCYLNVNLELWSAVKHRAVML